MTFNLLLLSSSSPNFLFLFVSRSLLELCVLLKTHMSRVVETNPFIFVNLRYTPGFDRLLENDQDRLFPCAIFKFWNLTKEGRRWKE